MGLVRCNSIRNRGCKLSFDTSTGDTFINEQDTITLAGVRTPTHDYRNRISEWGYHTGWYSNSVTGAVSLTADDPRMILRGNCDK